jgi:cysteine synthase A
LLRQDLVDGYLQVEDTEAIRVARRLAREEGIFAGFSSGANVAAALQLLQSSCRGKTIAVLLCDSGLKYLSTDLWE